MSYKHRYLFFAYGIYVNVRYLLQNNIRKRNVSANWLKISYNLESSKCSIATNQLLTPVQ
jgi:hypothetical protein